MAKVLGIDLGTTNSAMAVIEACTPVVLENAEGSRLTPSVVAIDLTGGHHLVGEAARRQATASPEHTIQSIKRFMGRKLADPYVQKARTHVPYDVRVAANGDVRVVVGDMAYAPPEISAMILRKLRQDAETRLGERITQAVITVPASFDERQRQATRDAGQIAGLEVLRIINEPTAASLAYGLDKATRDQTVAVYNLGGGTFDISILRIGEGVFEVVSTTGEIDLGGDDFTLRIVEWASDALRTEHGADLSLDTVASRRLADAAETAKIELSTVAQTEISLPFIVVDASGPRHLTLTLSRATLEQLTGDLVELTVAACQRALADAVLEAGEIDHVILVGGQTRMPAIGARLTTLFGKAPHRGVHPDEAVAVGAAIQASVLAGDLKNVLLVDVTSHTLGVETAGTIEGATGDNQPGDPVYALQPQANGGAMTPVIWRNTTIPTERSETFTTAVDGQTSVEVHILQGERRLASENTSLARFVLDGILPAPQGIPRITVSITIDADGIVNVSARDQATGKEQKIVARARSGLSQDEIKRMAREFESLVAAERLRREEIEERHRAENLTRTADKAIRASGDRLPDALKSELEVKTSALRDALTGTDVPRMRECRAALWDTLIRARQAIQLTKAQQTSRGVSRPPSGRETR